MSVLPLLMLTLGGCDSSAVDALKSCEGGNVEACYSNGMAAATAAHPRYGDARKWLSNACMSAHHAKACNELGVLVRDAKGGPKDLHRAGELFEIACKGGEQSACIDLGLLVYAPEGGVGLEEAPVRAVDLFTIACNEVDPGALAGTETHPGARACHALGRAWEDGKGVEGNTRDLVKAAALYLKSCDAGYAPGCVAGGTLAGSQMRRDKIDEAAQLFERACKLDARHGCFELAVLHEKKSWPDADDDQASLLYQKTCNIDPTRGCFEAASLMESGKVASREGEIEYLYNLACEYGRTEACTKRKPR